MTKMCIVCGYSVEDNVEECPNCGSYDLREVKKKDSFSQRFSRFT